MIQDLTSNPMKSTQKGFTLIELLVVIAIVAVLAVTVILTLNPAQLLRQARDSNRMNDLATMKSAISLYLADVSTPFIGTSTLCYAHTSSSAANCTARFSGGTITLSSSLSNGGTGWIPVNLTSLSAGAPLSALPIDPVNNATYYYAYKADNTAGTFELNADLESTKFASGGSSDEEGTDGGNSATLYEVGTDPGLDL
jgi:prepilin-type N-terminal cleavage/methylation domain-containing protein